MRQIERQKVVAGGDHVVCPDCGYHQQFPVLCEGITELCERCGRLFLVSAGGDEGIVTKQLGCCQHCGVVVNFDLFGVNAGWHQAGQKVPCPGVENRLVQQPENPPRIEMAPCPEGEWLGASRGA